MELVDLLLEVAAIAEVPVETVTPQARLIEDLALDSLALAELLAGLIEKHSLARLDEQVLERDWRDTTVGELFDAYCRTTEHESGEPSGVV